MGFLILIKHVFDWETLLSWTGVDEVKTKYLHIHAVQRRRMKRLPKPQHTMLYADPLSWTGMKNIFAIDTVLSDIFHFKK